VRKSPDTATRERHRRESARASGQLERIVLSARDA